mgnify:CR=1 FL=1
MKRYKTLSSEFSAWRNYLQENSGPQAEIDGEPQYLDAQAVPNELYHATRPPLVGRIMEDGLLDYSEMTRHGAGQMGISFTTDWDLAVSGNFGNAVIVFDGAALAASGQYRFESVQHPDAPNEAEIRVTMEDSALESGSGLDPAVDQLGTKIPFKPYAIKLVFPQGIQKFEAKWFQENFPDLEIEHYDRQKGEIVNIKDSY